jgi:hypothetical protein
MPQTNWCQLTSTCVRRRELDYSQSYRVFSKEDLIPSFIDCKQPWPPPTLAAQKHNIWLLDQVRPANFVSKVKKLFYPKK